LRREPRRPLPACCLPLLVSRAAAVFLTRSSAFLLRRFSVRRPLSSRPVFSAFRFSRVPASGLFRFRLPEVAVRRFYRAVRRADVPFSGYLFL